MHDILARVLSIIRSDGPSKALARCFRYALWRHKNYQLNNDEKRHTRTNFLKHLHRNWQMDIGATTESASGAGSTLDYTANIRQQLPQLFKDFSITSIYDAPCGDFNWMRFVIKQSDITYYGADIVPAMIEKIPKTIRCAKS